MGSYEDHTNIAPLPPADVLVCVRTGKIRPLGGVSLKSAINKSRRQGKVQVTDVGLVGDEQQYALHGGVDKALHQYCATHYDTWNAEVPDRAHLFRIGGFGENLSTVEFTEDNLCIGDKLRIGEEVIVQVSEPRQPCYKLNHRFEFKHVSIMTQRSGRTGWYLRVLKPGYIQEGDTMELLERVNPTWSISRVQKFLYHDIDNYDALVELSELPGLGAEILKLFRTRLLHGAAEDMSDRLEGIPGKNRISIAWQTYKLTGKTSLTPRIKKFVFSIIDANISIENPQFDPFAHVRLKFGPNAKFTRAYSVVSGDKQVFELGVARDDQSRGGSLYLHDNLEVGDTVEIANGYTTQAHKQDTQQDDKRYVFIIGGIGITAFISKIRSMPSDADYEIHYAVRSRRDAAYPGFLPPEKTTLYPRDENKRLDVTKVIPLPADDKSFKGVIYCCGPPSLLNACLERTTQLGYPSAHLHFEDFFAGPQTASTGEPFEARIKTSGQVLKVPGDKTLLRVMNEAGFDVPSSCLAGNCGMCMVDLYSGEAIHRGTALSDEQKCESILSCISRGRGQIVVDY